MKHKIHGIVLVVAAVGLIVVLWEVRKYFAAPAVTLGGGKVIAKDPIDAQLGVDDINNALDPTSAASPGFSQTAVPANESFT